MAIIMGRGRGQWGRGGARGENVDRELGNRGVGMVSYYRILCLQTRYSIDLNL